jgi:hypothetical protein
MKSSRLRTFTLWTGTTLCVLIAAAFVASARWLIAFQVTRPSGRALYLAAGSVLIVTDDMLSAPVSIDSHSFRLARWNSWVAWRGGYAMFPLYAVFLAVAVPTLLVWRFWPKPVKPGHCRCGYDLTGNTSGVCPECGQPFEPKGGAT